MPWEKIAVTRQRPTILTVAGVILLYVVAPPKAGHAEQTERPAIEPLLRAVDLRIGEEATVTLCDGSQATVKLIDLEERRDGLRNAVRRALATVEVNGRRVVLPSATYHLPVTVGSVQIDCPITKGYLEHGDHWGLDADVRLRLWPARSPWIRPGTFAYPVNQKWFAGYTLMANEIGDGEQVAKKSIYYHWGLDMGGAERMVDVLAATDGRVVSARGELLEPADYPALVKPRYDVIYVQDARGWYYRYSHLDSIDPAVQPGAEVRQGQKIGVLGKEGASGGWSHLHFDIVAPQPSGKYGIAEGYAFLWQAYHAAHGTKLQAVARPHQLAWAGDPVTLDGTRSWSARGPEHIASYRWKLTDGTTAQGATVEHRYDRAGTYSEILEITDDEGRVDCDFALVQIVDRQWPDRQAPRVHAAYWPTFGIRPGDEVTFKVRTFRVRPDEGHETWDFGDGSPAVETQSDGGAEARAKDGYAVTTHRYARPGRYIVSVERKNDRGEVGMDHLQVVVEDDAPAPKPATSAPLERIRPSDDGTHFVRVPSGERFVAWGFNYDHDEAGRLLEDYWLEHWPTVVEDFREMKELGANVVRIHLQTGRFMKTPEQPDKSALEQLRRLVGLAEQTGLYLDVTGLGCYHKDDVPAWYDALSEAERWDVQARFWEAVAATCAPSDAIFCYDLMNEPILPGKEKETEWLTGELGGKHFVQRISLDLAGRTRKQVAKAWVDKLTGAIRKHDDRHMVTVGVIPWAHVFPKAKPLFYSSEVGANLDFVSVHFYPERGKVDKALAALAVYGVGKPLVVEEMFPLKCGTDELCEFIDRSREIADGWISFYWGKGPDEITEADGLAGAIKRQWLERFRAKSAEILEPSAQK